MKAYGGSEVTGLLVLNLGTKGRRTFSFTPKPLKLEKEPSVRLKRWLDGLHDRPGRFGKEKSLLPLSGIES